ncbi:MAG TPA: hypothetical protein ENF22_04505 [Chloroflexi bacterium]|nr:hypothetical protein [Chloroflexota bacterium]
MAGSRSRVRVTCDGLCSNDSLSISPRWYAVYESLARRIAEEGQSGSGAAVVDGGLIYVEARPTI